MVVVRFISDMLGEFDSTINFGILLARTDQRVSAVHITIFAALSNMCSFLHKLYIFKIVDAYGIFGPQLVIGGFCLVLICLLRRPFISMSTVPVSAWFIGNKALN